jgi:hypothetical protein
MNAASSIESTWIEVWQDMECGWHSNGAHIVAAAGDVDRRRAPRYSAPMRVR